MFFNSQLQTIETVSSFKQQLTWLQICLLRESDFKLSQFFFLMFLKAVLLKAKFPK